MLIWFGLDLYIGSKNKNMKKKDQENVCCTKVSNFARMMENEVQLLRNLSRQICVWLFFVSVLVGFLFCGQAFLILNLKY
jgi:hypothetical protein